jgi:hypothetical protein
MEEHGLRCNGHKMEEITGGGRESRNGEICDLYARRIKEDEMSGRGIGGDMMCVQGFVRETERKETTLKN